MFINRSFSTQSLQIPRRRDREPLSIGLGLNKSSFEYRVFCRCFSNALTGSTSKKGIKIHSD